MKIKWKLLIACIALPLIVGGLASLLTMDSMETFEALSKPPLSPPGWLFPAVWTVLYILMGVASYLVLVSGSPQDSINRALKFYGIQLALNFGWTLLFFNLSAYWVAFAWLLLLWIFVFLTWREFKSNSAAAGWLLVPYLIWITFAAYLNAGIAYLN